MAAQPDRRVAFISEFIELFGGRPSASEQEREAQLHLREKLLELSPHTHVQEFENAIGAKFGSLKWFCAGFWLLLALFYFFPLIAVILAVLVGVLFVWHFLLYGDVLDKIWPKKKSLNVYTVLEPQAEVRSTLWFSGHMDSVREFQWWNRLKSLGMVMTLLSGVLFITWALVSTAWFWMYFDSKAGFWEFTYPGDAPWFAWIFWGYVVLSPITLSMFFMHGKRAVDGASDNLSGVAQAWSLGVALVDTNERGKSILQHTRIGIMSFGCEEMGLKGAKFWAKAQGPWLQQDGAVVINIDTIKDPEFLTLVTGEKNPMVRYRKDLVERVGESFQSCEVPVIRTQLNVGATDAAALHRHKIPAVSIIGMDSKKLDPCYHTRLDTLENLNPKGMADLEKVLLHFVKKWDEEQPTIA